MFLCKELFLNVNKYSLEIHTFGNFVTFFWSICLFTLCVLFNKEYHNFYRCVIFFFVFCYLAFQALEIGAM